LVHSCTSSSIGSNKENDSALGDVTCREREGEEGKIGERERRGRTTAPWATSPAHTPWNEKKKPIVR